ncbi:MAG: ArnT family glycosyltransferase, partial [Candidatus Rokuibacteriota bacterium]
MSVRVRHAASVAAAFGLVALAAAVWLAVDRRPPEWDYANHLERGVLCVRDLGRGELREVLRRGSFYPPLVPCLGGLATVLAGSDVGAGVAVIVVFLAIGMAATYLLGRRVGGAAAGAAAAVVFGTAPFVVWQSLRFQLDVPLAAMVALALEALLRTDAFARPAASLAAGLVFGLGMLTKPPFVVYVLPPVLLALARARWPRALPGLVGFALAGTFVALPWYGPRLFGLSAQIGARSFRQAAEQGHPDPLTAASLLYYPLNFAVQLGVVGVALFAVGLVVCARRRDWFSLVALLPLFVFLAIQNKQLRYTLPLVPAAAVVAGAGFAALGPR